MALPGADISDIIMVIAGRKPCRINDPNREDTALRANFQQSSQSNFVEQYINAKCPCCNQYCWNSIELVVVWGGHNNCLRANENINIHPPMMPPYIYKNIYGNYY